MKPAQTIELTSFDGRIPSELSADYILPDTFPDVKKVLRTKAKPILIGRYISGRRLEFTGAVDYTVIFCADSEDGESLHCVHFAGEWNGALGELDSLENANVTITPHVTSCTQRLANPRKLTLKSTISSDVRVTVPIPAAPVCEGAASTAEELSLEKLSRTYTTRRERTFVAEPLRISENLEPDAAQPAIDEIISCNAEICFSEAKISREHEMTVALKGEALIDCIYKSQAEAGVYKSFSRKVPVACIVGADEYRDYFYDCRPESMCANASATTVEINASVGENGYGERRVVELDMTADVTVSLIGGEDVQLVLDAYSVTRDAECVMSDHGLISVGKVLFANFSVGEALSREELGIPENANVINAEAEVISASMSLERGRLVLSGMASVSCILEGDGYSSIDASIPVKCELNAGELHEPISYNCEFAVSDLRARLDPERICFDFEVSLCAEVCEKHRRSAVSVIRLTGESRSADADASLTLCYPSSGDTLWEIAKRYKTTVGALEAANTAGSRVLLVVPPKNGIVI